MGFNMVFVLVNERKTTPLQIARGLKRIDSKYRFESEEYFIYDNDLYGQIEINRPGDALFVSDIERFKQLVIMKPEEPGAIQVAKYLESATGLFFVQVIWEDRDREETLKRYYPLWDWFFAHREGVLFVDFEGFYDATGLLLAV